MKLLRPAPLLLLCVALSVACAGNPAAEDSGKVSKTRLAARPDNASRASGFTGADSGDAQAYVFQRRSVKGRELFFIKQKPGLLPMTALGGGKLVVDGRGCFRMRSPGQKLGLLLIWPAHFRLETGGGKVRILNGKGRVVAKPGDELRVGGGMMSGLGSGMTSDVAFDRERNVPKKCRRGAHWILGQWQSPRLSK